MKRTKEAYYRENPSFEQTQLSSGVTFVIGEDQAYYDRTREFQKLQKEFLDEQVEQKKLINNAQKQTSSQFDQQLLLNTHQRGQLDMEYKQRSHEVEKAHDNYNLNLVFSLVARPKRGNKGNACNARKNSRTNDDSLSCYARGKSKNMGYDLKYSYFLRVKGKYEDEE